MWDQRLCRGEGGCRGQGSPGMLGRMPSGATTLSPNGDPVSLGWKKPCQKKKKCCLMQSPEARAGWEWCPCVRTSEGKHDPISQQWRSSVSVQPLSTTSWLLPPCRDKRNKGELSIPGAGGAPEKGCPNKGGHRPLVPCPACSSDPSAQTLASSGMWEQGPQRPSTAREDSTHSPQWCPTMCLITLHQEPGGGTIIKGIAGV